MTGMSKTFTITVAIVLFVIEGSQKLEICTVEAPWEPQAGQTIIALVEPVAEVSAQECAPP